MSAYYSVAMYFDDEALQLAASKRYSYRDRQIAGAPRTAGGYCPLGVLARAIGLHVAKAPAADDLCDAMRERPPGGGNWDSFEDEADAFINDWDDGRITGLASAFGLRQA